MVLITSRTLVGFAALAVVVSASTRTPAAVHHDVAIALVGQSLGQSIKPTAADRREAEALMARAREALKQGDLQTAESQVAGLEKMNVQYGVLHLGDTPRKLRADLEAAQRSPKKNLKKPSQKFTPEMPAASRARTKPIEPQASGPPQFPREVLDPQAEQPLAVPESEGRVKPVLAPLGAIPSPEQELPEQTRLPAPRRQSPEVVPAGAVEEPPVAPRGDARRQSDFHLLAARKALAVGDVRRATQAVEASRGLQVEYGLHDDTPKPARSGPTKPRAASWPTRYWIRRSSSSRGRNTTRPRGSCGTSRDCA
jgi:hypothetical protein